MYGDIIVVVVPRTSLVHIFNRVGGEWCKDKRLNNNRWSTLVLQLPYSWVQNKRPGTVINFWKLFTPPRTLFWTLRLLIFRKFFTHFLKIFLFSEFIRNICDETHLNTLNNIVICKQNTKYLSLNFGAYKKACTSESIKNINL